MALVMFTALRQSIGALECLGHTSNKELSIVKIAIIKAYFIPYNFLVQANVVKNYSISAIVK
jgi:hypothetical protein